MERRLFYYVIKMEAGARPHVRRNKKMHSVSDQVCMNTYDNVSEGADYM